MFGYDLLTGKPSKSNMKIENVQGYKKKKPRNFPKPFWNFARVEPYFHGLIDLLWPENVCRTVLFKIKAKDKFIDIFFIFQNLFKFANNSIRIKSLSYQFKFRIFI